MYRFKRIEDSKPARILSERPAPPDRSIVTYQLDGDEEPREMDAIEFAKKFAVRR